MQIIYQTQKSNTPTVATQPTVLVSNPARLGFTVQNQGTNPLWVLLGTGATPTVFHVALKGGTALNDGNGGIYTSTSVCYTGIVSATGTTPTYTVLEMAP
jgi:hypothetical protein